MSKYKAFRITNTFAQDYNVRKLEKPCTLIVFPEQCRNVDVDKIMYSFNITVELGDVTKGSGWVTQRDILNTIALYKPNKGEVIAGDVCNFNRVGMNLRGELAFLPAGTPLNINEYFSLKEEHLRQHLQTLAINIERTADSLSADAVRKAVGCRVSEKLTERIRSCTSIEQCKSVIDTNLPLIHDVNVLTDLKITLLNKLADENNEFSDEEQTQIRELCNQLGSKVQRCDKPAGKAAFSVDPETGIQRRLLYDIESLKEKGITSAITNAGIFTNCKSVAECEIIRFQLQNSTL